ncbi:unnamed protein product [Thelazia callipaeda]|uniref:ABC transporter permease n=1 Tax=Thelazia callipaeda TaxID=103827 RepID=A0A0N5CW41_THECL|nr:unnamed protein product [Thelazia callipaeda]
MIDYLGIVAIIFFYLLILVVGIWAGRKAKNVNTMLIDGEQTEEVMLAGRNIGTLVGIFTMTVVIKQTKLQTFTVTGDDSLYCSNGDATVTNFIC